MNNECEFSYKNENAIEVYEIPNVVEIFFVPYCSSPGGKSLYWPRRRENLSSGFPPKRVSNQSPQLQRLARKFKFHL